MEENEIYSLLYQTCFEALDEGMVNHQIIDHMVDSVFPKCIELGKGTIEHYAEVVYGDVINSLMDKD